MIFSRCALLILSASSLLNCQEQSPDKILKDIKDSAVPAITWGFEKAQEYPQVPGIFLAGVLRAFKQELSQKPATFMVWGLLGSTVLAEMCKITATNYLALQKDKGERAIKEHWLDDLKASRDTLIKKAADAFSDEADKNSDSQEKK